MNHGYGYRLKRDFQKNRSLYFMIIPVVLFYILFHYKTMYGAIIAFYNYRPARGLEGSKWVGLDHFIYFFKSPFFMRTLKNTLAISLLNLLFAFPAPIILALLLNEVRNKYFKKVVQTVTYLPHFISSVIICGMLTSFCLSTGLFNDIIELFGGKRIPLLQGTDYYRTIYIASDIWQTIGWSSIIYLAALSGVDNPGRYPCRRFVEGRGDLYHLRYQKDFKPPRSCPDQQDLRPCRHRLLGQSAIPPGR